MELDGIPWYDIPCPTDIWQPLDASLATTLKYADIQYL